MSVESFCTDVLIKPDDNVPLNYDTRIIKFDLHCNLVLRECQFRLSTDCTDYQYMHANG